MARNDEDVVVTEKKKRPIFLMVIIGLIIVLAVAGGVAYFVATHYMGFGKTANAPREQGVFVKLGDPKEGLIVNVGNSAGGRYLKIGVILELKPDKKSATKEGKGLSPEEVKIQDAVLFVLRSQRIEEFDPNRQERLKELIKHEVNKVLGEDRVYDVYITTLLLQ